MVVGAELESHKRVFKNAHPQDTSLAFWGEEASDRNINHYYLARLIVCLRMGYEK